MEYTKTYTLMHMCVLYLFVCAAVSAQESVNVGNYGDGEIPGLIAGRSNRPTMLNIDGLAAKRCEDVELNISLFGDETEAKPLRAGDLIRLNLFKDTDLTARVLRQSTDINGVHGVTCSIVGTKYGRAYLSSRDGLLMAHMLLPETQQDFVIGYDRIEQTHRVYDIDRRNTDFLPDAHAVIPEGAFASQSPDDILNSSKATDTAISHDLFSTNQSLSTTSNAKADVMIDIMFVYTEYAKNRIENRFGNIDLILNQDILDMKEIHYNSLTRMQVNMVFSAMIDYTESGSAYDDLDWLTFSDESKATIHQLRNEHKADFVCLIAQFPDYGGIAWSLNNPNGMQNYAFSVVRSLDACWADNVAHELGHNMGAGHSKTQSMNPGPGLFSYSAGWQWDDMDQSLLGKCTVMTYESEWEGIPYFSNPDVYYEGFVTGNPADGDNARTIREMRKILSDYRHLNHPTEIINNETLETFTNKVELLSNVNLRSLDPDILDGDTTEKIIYSIAAAPIRGNLFLDANGNNIIDENELIAIQSTFTQADIDNGKLKYLTTSFSATSDQFTFNVADDEDAGVESQTFNVNIINAPTLYVDGVFVNEVDEGTTNTTATIRLSYDPGATVTVDYATQDASAENESGDYLSTSGSLSFESGELEKTIEIQVSGDYIDEDDEIIHLILSNPVNAGVYPNPGIITFIDNDLAGLAVSDPIGSTTEYGGTTDFTLALTSQPLKPVTVQIASSNSNEGEISPAIRVYTPENWNIPQELTATGQDDNVNDDHSTFNILAVTTSDDVKYNDFHFNLGSISNIDNECVIETLASHQDWFTNQPPGGSIDPPGDVPVQEGHGQAFAFTPDAGYEMYDVKVDGVSHGPITAFTFENVMTTRTLEAIFIPINRPGMPIISGDLFTSDTTPTWRWLTGEGGDYFFHYQWNNHIPESMFYFTTQTRVDAKYPQPDGPVTLWLRCRNSAANWSEWASYTITVDTTSPTLTLATDAGEWTSEPFAVRSVFNEPVREFAPDVIQVTNGAVSDLATEDNITFTFTVTPLDSGEVSVQLPKDATRDRAGMPSEPSNIINTVFRDPDSAAGGHWILLE